MDTHQEMKYMDLPELYPPFNGAATDDHTDRCPLCNQPRIILDDVNDTDDIDSPCLTDMVCNPPRLSDMIVDDDTDGPPPLGRPDRQLGLPAQISDGKRHWLNEWFPEQKEREPPSMTRCLSTHHWHASMVEMAKNRRREQWSGDFHSFDAVGDEIVVHPHRGWNYYLHRDQVTRKGKVVREVYKVSAQIDEHGDVIFSSTEVDRLPVATRCHAHVAVRENITGKGANKYVPRCKNMTYQHYCHAHRHA